jgi:hypothetical protein
MSRVIMRVKRSRPGVGAGDLVLEERRDVEQPRGLAEGEVLALVGGVVARDRAVARPVLPGVAPAERCGALVERRWGRHRCLVGSELAGKVAVRISSSPTRSSISVTKPAGNGVERSAPRLRRQRGGWRSDEAANVVRAAHPARASTSPRRRSSPKSASGSSAATGCSPGMSRSCRSRAATSSSSSTARASW